MKKEVLLQVVETSLTREADKRKQKIFISISDFQNDFFKNSQSLFQPLRLCLRKCVLQHTYEVPAQQILSS